jgi:4-amino-4-deoxy-L-arabinose transferase-like glycosyltransferase
MKKHKASQTTETCDPKAALSESRWPSLLVVAGLCFAIAVLRLHTYDEPFERDITSHAVIARQMLSGHRLYSDLWDSKPPAIFVTYAAGELVAGFGPGSVYLIGVAAAVVTLFGVYLAASVHGGRTAGLWAAAFWAVISGDLWLWANQPNIEVGINACVIFAFFLILRAGTGRLEAPRWIAAGVLFALATLYKPVAITFAVVPVAFYLAIELSAGRKAAIVRACLAAAAAAAVWAAVFAYFAATDRLGIFHETIFEYGGYYAQSRGGSVFANILEGFKPGRIFCGHMKSTVPPALAAAAGTIIGICAGNRRHWLLLVAFALAAQLAVSLPGRFYGHYYQLWLGPLVVGAGWAVAALRRGGKPVTGVLSVAAGSLVLAGLLFLVVPQYRFSPDEWSARKQGPQYIIVKELAGELDRLLAPDETLYVWGINPGLYFWSNRTPPTGLIWSTDLLLGPLAERHTIRALGDLKNNPPEIVVVNMLHVDRPADHPVIRWIKENYAPLSARPRRGTLYGRPFFLIMARRYGRLAPGPGA